MAEGVVLSIPVPSEAGERQALGLWLQGVVAAAVADGRGPGAGLSFRSMAAMSRQLLGGEVGSVE